MERPNSRVEVPNEPNSYPYEIWHYFQINNQTNGKFVFWSQDNVTNDYEVLHSTIFTEVNNPRWEMMLQQRNTSLYDLDQVDPGYSTGSRAKEYWIPLDRKAKAMAVNNLILPVSSKPIYLRPFFKELKANVKTQTCYCTVEL